MRLDLSNLVSDLVQETSAESLCAEKSEEYLVLLRSIAVHSTAHTVPHALVMRGMRGLAGQSHRHWWDGQALGQEFIWVGCRVAPKVYERILTMSSHGQTNRYDYTTNPAHFSHYVIAVIDKPYEAKQAATALHAAGFANDDIELSPEADKGAALLQESKGMSDSLAEPPTVSEELFSEEGLARELYTTERALGRVVIRVHTPTKANVETARQVLAKYHAYDIRRVSPWTRETLSDEPGPVS